MPIHKINVTANRGVGAQITKETSVEHEGEIYDVVDIPNATTNQEIALVFTMAQLKSIMIKTDGALTIKTNSSGAPDDTFTFAAAGDSWLAWNTKSLLVNPFTADVTKIYVTNASGATVRLTIVGLRDITV